MQIKVSASILSADFCNLADEIKKLEQAGADYLHIDVMDGCFVPNITIGQPVVKAIKKYTSLPLDVHLMIQNPIKYIADFANSGADIITIHQEAEPHLDKAIALIKLLGKKAGISLCPATSETTLNYILPQLDQILIMTVNPGFGGQQFLDSQIQKIKNIRNMIDISGYKIDLQVDGGINDITYKSAIKAGANVLVSGNYIFSGGNYSEKIIILKNY